MLQGARTRIHRLSILCGLVAGLAFIVPRFVPNQEGGFAAAATAILVLLAMLAAVAVLSVGLLVSTIRVYRDIPVVTRLAGIGPSVIIVTALLILLGLLRY